MSDEMPVTQAPKYDLHTHSLASDGTYRPAELVSAAVNAGVTHLALTDHDTTDGLSEAEQAAEQLGLRLLPGVEISVTWQGKTLHVVGLNIDPAYPELAAGLADLQARREIRANEIDRRLAKDGIPDTLAEARLLAGAGMVTRTHFARVLAARHLAGSVRDVFDRYLTQGRPGYVATEWAGLVSAITWINGAGGVAVIAHPQRYKLSATWLRRLCGEFKEAGGRALEVVSGNQAAGDAQSTAHYCRTFGLLGSVGSDFHSPDYPWCRLGLLAPLPVGVSPVWSAWDD